MTSQVLRDLPAHVDISCVQAFHTECDVRALADAAISGGFVSAHVLPHWVPLLRDLLTNSSTLVGAPVAFPAGGATAESKLAEVSQLLELGVEELDVVTNIGRLRSGDYRYVVDELSEVVERVNGRVPLRAIIEVGHLDDRQIDNAARCVVTAGVPWVKTGTGWSGQPTLARHIDIIAKAVDGRAQIKAAGGIRDLVTVKEMATLGATRFGMNAAVAIELAGQARLLTDERGGAVE